MELLQASPLDLLAASPTACLLAKPGGLLTLQHSVPLQVFRHVSLVNLRVAHGLFVLTKPLVTLVLKATPGFCY